MLEKWMLNFIPQINLKNVGKGSSVYNLTFPEVSLNGLIILSLYCFLSLSCDHIKILIVYLPQNITMSNLSGFYLVCG